jgi:uncharacterized membrane protein YeaQ/YmgE (transglycosylase-associated protein family)
LNYPFTAFWFVDSGNRGGRQIRGKRSRIMPPWVWFIVIGIVAGWLAGLIMKGGGYGLLGDLIVGIIGALLGGWLFGLLGISAGGGLVGSLIVALVGAIVLIALLRLIKRGA